ncbi:MAG: hypothetical protein HY276_03865 [Ignavibacteriales bacterium]|nr:hypothetical protein [Ignavibacteriales bacterium]
MKKLMILFSLMVTIFSLLLGSCDEELPVYQAPNNRFAGALKPSYILTPSNNEMSIELFVLNVFDETFQAPGILKGSIEIVSVKDPSVRRIFTLGSGNLIRTPEYNRTTGILTMDPGDTVHMGVTWLLDDERDKDLRIDFFRYVQDKTCPLRCLAYPEDFIITAELKLYDQRAPIRFGPLRYSFCLVSNYVNPRFGCPPILTSSPCVLKPSDIGGGCSPEDFNPIL